MTSLCMSDIGGGIKNYGWEFLPHPPYSSKVGPLRLPSVQNSEKITQRPSTVRTWQSRKPCEHGCRMLKQTATAAYSSFYSTSRSVCIMMGILWKSDRTSLVTENYICFCTCTLVLIYYKHNHYFHYSPHRIRIVGLKNWR